MIKCWLRNLDICIVQEQLKLRHVPKQSKLRHVEEQLKHRHVQKQSKLRHVQKQLKHRHVDEQLDADTGNVNKLPAKLR